MVKNYQSERSIRDNNWWFSNQTHCWSMSYFQERSFSFFKMSHFNESFKWLVQGSITGHNGWPWKAIRYLTSSISHLRDRNRVWIYHAPWKLVNIGEKFSLRTKHILISHSYLNEWLKIHKLWNISFSVMIVQIICSHVCWKIAMLRDEKEMLVKLFYLNLSKFTLE